MSLFKHKSVKQLQSFLKDHGVTFADLRKPTLIELCDCAVEIGLEIDPDGLVEDREEVITSKLVTPDNTILSNPLSKPDSEFSNDLSHLPPISIFDMYNYLVSFDGFDHASLRDYYRMEGYTMAQDGYVLDLQVSNYVDNPEYVILKSKVKPRTREKDPVTKLPHYKTWIIATSASSRGSLYSAFCSCKGG